MPPPAPSSVARQTVSCAFKELEKTITPGDARDFPTITLQDVRSEVLKIENELASRQSLRNLRRLAPLFQGLEHYEKAMGVLCNGTPFLPWVWAPISLILRIASEHIEAFDHIIKAYSRISECLGRFAVLNHSFATNHDFQQTLAVFYADILEFHKHAYQFVRRSGWKLFFVTSWHRFQRRFDNIFENLQRHASLIDKEANAYNIAEAKQMRQEIRTWRDECTEQLDRTEEEQGIKQYNSIVSWLRVDESDQLNIFHTLLEESNKHPGTCDWILRNKKMTSMLQRKPDIPVLWIQGAAGTGKSVISASIVKFMESAGCLVLSHFCNYAYPSSTKYDSILRSLIVQLVRKDGDLAAHVYENYILGKKVPSIPILERLLQLLLSSISKEPRQTSYVWVVIDGVDECEPLMQSKTCNLISQVTSRAPSSDQVVCKALVSCRFSTTASANLRKCQSISLTEEKEQMSNSIRRYASQRLTAIYSKFQQLNLTEHDIRRIEDAITEKSDGTAPKTSIASHKIETNREIGMFLYARLVLDYLSSNIFFNGEEIKRDVYKLPAKLSEFYSKIVTQILVRLDSTSVERIKCALGWIAFSKRPLKKIELLSAIAFSAGDTGVELVAPQYMLDICATLIEERPDSRLGFIHVSVKEFLTSSSSNLVLAEKDCLLQHGVATVTCLLAGTEAFSNGLPHDSRYEQMLVRVIRGLHSFHVYAKEFWTDYLLSLCPPEEKSHSDASSLFNLAIQLATRLDQLSPRPSQSSATLQIAQGGDQRSPMKYADDRIRNLLDPLLQDVVNRCLKARTSERLEQDLQQLEARGQPMNYTEISSIPAPEEGVSLILKEYQATLKYILSQPDYPDVTAADLESFKRQFRSSVYTCRVRGCPRATDGFAVQGQCYQHEFLHVRRLICTYQGCQYPPFITPRALKNHPLRESPYEEWATYLPVFLELRDSTVLILNRRQWELKLEIRKTPKKKNQNILKTSNGNCSSWNRKRRNAK
ncbi:hypothetical protein PG999_007379 [Apiospora kogelbergensis]|uniref:NACHT domain-containing protein n=1 Tax=Apiospora kogelbergensis TaxID=1337665 RepID=A0AAW0QY45_9PEZI